MDDIIVKNATKRFGKTVAVDHVSIEIEAGSLFFLLGPSGCGKTTLLRMIAGFSDIEEGDILFGTHSLKGVAPGKRNTAMVFQNYVLQPQQEMVMIWPMRVPVGARRCRRICPASTLGKKSRPSSGNNRQESRQKPMNSEAKPRRCASNTDRASV